MHSERRRVSEELVQSGLMGAEKKMLTHAERKRIVGLHRKKGRAQSDCFLVEGTKSIEDLLKSGFAVECIVATEAWQAPVAVSCPVHRVGEDELKKLSALETPQGVLAVVKMPYSSDVWTPKGRWLGLDGIQDPGNLGTLLRLADWFGLEGIVCSSDCVDRFNPKVVQASMGSIFRVPVVTADLATFLRELPEGFVTAGAFLDGENVYRHGMPEEGILILGNEGRGIRAETEKEIQLRLTIPGRGRAESLNAAMAGAVFCSEWMRPGSV
jgi:TrmH family RNA methyltransferase